MTDHRLFAVLGFAAAVVWGALGLGWALLALAAALLAGTAGRVATGELDLGELQDRFADRPRQGVR